MRPSTAKNFLASVLVAALVAKLMQNAPGGWEATPIIIVTGFLAMMLAMRLNP